MYIFIALVFISLVSAGSESGQPGNRADALAPDIRAPRIRYIANSGMLVSMAGRRFLIDAPIRDGIAPYATSSADERAQLEGSKAPYDGIDAILVTHWHEDHFSADAVAAHLSRNLRTIFISSREVVDRLREAAPRIQQLTTLPCFASCRRLASRCCRSGIYPTLRTGV